MARSENRGEMGVTNFVIGLPGYCNMAKYPKGFVYYTDATIEDALMSIIFFSELFKTIIQIGTRKGVVAQQENPDVVAVMPN